MSFFRYRRLLVFEEVLPLHAYHHGLFVESGAFDDFRVAATEDEILKYTTPRSIPIRSKSKKLLDLVFLLCTKAYLAFIKSYHFVRELFPDSPIILHDDSPKQGSIYLADSFHLQGCSTYQDDREDVLNCVSKIAEGTPAVAPSVAHLLHIDESRGALQGKAEYKESKDYNISGLYSLGPREWACFLHLAADKSLDDFAKLEGLSENYAKKLMYQMLNKLGINSAAKLIPIAREWGFV